MYTILVPLLLFNTILVSLMAIRKKIKKQRSTLKFNSSMKMLTTKIWNKKDRIKINE